MSLDTLIAGIERDAKEEADRLLARAAEDVARILAAAQAETAAAAEHERTAEVARCSQEAAQRVSQARLAARNRLLDAEQALIDQVLDEVLGRLRAQDDAAYRAWMKHQVLATVRAPEERIVVSARDRTRLGPSWQREVEAALRARQGLDRLQVEYVDDDLGGGFIVRHPKYDVDVTFGALLAALRAERRADVARRLFET